MTSSVKTVIVGGGLSGLFASALLEARGNSDHVVLEARSAFGGRIRSEAIPDPLATLAAETVPVRFDVGATWFWPALQPELTELVKMLDLRAFEQSEQGAMLIERSATAAPQVTPGYVSSPAAMRLNGGMATLIDALRKQTHPERRRSGYQVTHVRRLGAMTEVETMDQSGAVCTWTTERVLMAVPPRLAASSIVFSPALPPDLERQWRGTPTWMAPHAKYVAVYDRPFWKEQRLSGEARSTVGPMVELHDASQPGGLAALFGFVGVPAGTRAQLPPDALRDACRRQMARLFGAAATSPLADYLMDWAAEPFTATSADLAANGVHVQAPSASASAGVWKDRLIGIASEWSPEFPGYVAGAIDAARRGVEQSTAHPPLASEVQS